MFYGEQKSYRKLCGIINDTVFINGSMFHTGDKIDDYTIEEINQDKIKIKSLNGEEKNVDLGESF